MEILKKILFKSNPSSFTCIKKLVFFKDGEQNKAQAAVEVAISAGYRHIDTASLYSTEKQIGLAIKTKIEDGTIKREDLFVTTKV